MMGYTHRVYKVSHQNVWLLGTLKATQEDCSVIASVARTSIDEGQAKRNPISTYHRSAQSAWRIARNNLADSPANLYLYAVC